MRKDLSPECIHTRVRIVCQVDMRAMLIHMVRQILPHCLVCSTPSEYSPDVRNAADAIPRLAAANLQSLVKHCMQGLFRRIANPV